MRISNVLELIGFSEQSFNTREKLISTIGGFLGIYVVLMISFSLLDPEFAVYIVPSMGATAVLLFAAPHAALSQPWNVIAGHTFSAIVGVMCWQWIPDYHIAAAASVGLAIGIMTITRSIHPPGGATAIAAVVGSEKLHDLGHAYVLQPVLLNALTMVIVAVLFNSLFKWRLYPAHLHIKTATIDPVEAQRQPITHDDFVYALSHIDTFVDIEEDDLLKIYQLATKRHSEVTSKK